MLQVNQRLGDFEILRRLGKGGMGEVYEAWQFNPPRRVALKVLVPWLADDEKALQRFWREAAFPAQLDHPGIVRIITTGKQDGVAFYTMQLVLGVSLAELMRQASETQESEIANPTDTSTVGFHPSPAESDLPTPEPWPAGRCPPAIRQEYVRDRAAFAIRVGIQVARTLAAAHRQGVLHRDIKPANIMIDHHGQLYVVDFGLTAALDGAADLSGGGLRGTPLYMAPEQARGDKVDQRSDIYSLGITLYELITGGIGPYTANRDSKEAVLAQVKAGQVLPLRAVAPGVRHGLEKTVHKSLALKPRRRHQGANELAMELERLADTSLADDAAPAIPRFGGWKTWAIAGVGSFVMLGGLVWGFCKARWQTSESFANLDTPEESTQPSTPMDGSSYPSDERSNWRSNVEIALLDKNHWPLWYRKASAAGSMNPTPGVGLKIDCPPADLQKNLPSRKFAMYVLEDDPRKRSFEFKVDISSARRERKKREEDKVGIFLGQPKSDRPGLFDRSFLIIELVDPSDRDAWAAHLEISAVTLREGNADRPPFDARRPVPLIGSDVPLRKSGDWHTLIVRVVGKHITVSCDEERKEIDLEEARKLDSNVATQSLVSNGAIGLWTANGTGLFRNATITYVSQE
jgi:serine/threonine protein kinase